MPKTRQQRRARARSPLKKKRRGTLVFTVFLLVLLAGGSFAALSFRTHPPTLTRGAIAGEHWHAAYRIYICGKRMLPFPSVEGEIHSHGDGFIHDHPSTPAASGANANLGTFLRLYETSIGVTKGKRFIAFPDGTRYRDGNKCPDGKRYDLVLLNKGKTYKGDPSKFLMHDGDQIVIHFGPTGKQSFENPYTKAKGLPQVPHNPSGVPAPDSGVPQQQQQVPSNATNPKPSG
jgi:hypothetical protein